jgi:hypothetical protein
MNLSRQIATWSRSFFFEFQILIRPPRLHVPPGTRVKIQLEMAASILAQISSLSSGTTPTSRAPIRVLSKRQVK